MGLTKRQAQLLSPNDVRVSSLSQILQDQAHRKYYLSRKACQGILRRAQQRGKALPPPLEQALRRQAGEASLPTEVGAPPLAFHINQREETIDLGETAGAILATQNMQMQTFVSQPEPATQREPQAVASTVNQRDEARNLHGRAGALTTRSSAKQQTCIAAFNAGAGASAGTIGYGEACTPTLKAAPGGNMAPTVLCLNDQGGQRMGAGEISDTLRAAAHGHQPLVTDATAYCLTGNCIDRQPQSGGNGLGCQENLAYTLTATDRHAVFDRRRVDVFRPDDTASTQSARQGKDATDLVFQETGGTLTGSNTANGRGRNDRHDAQDGPTAETPCLIRRLTPLECERLQGFPDGWTDLPGASDTARYKALGNSVAIPCVKYILRGIALALGGAVEEKQKDPSD